MALDPNADDRDGEARSKSSGSNAPTVVAPKVSPAAIESVAITQLSERYGELRLSRPGLVAALRRSIERNGLLRPLLVNLERDGKLAVLDGFKRLRALRELDLRQAMVRVVQLDEAAARIAMLLYNAPHRGLCELEQAWVVRSLVRGCKLPQSRVAELIGRHKSWVCRRLALCEQLDDSLQRDMRLGLLSATMARELTRLPRGNQAPVALAIQQHRLSCRQCAKLVDNALSCRDVRALDALLRDPWPKLVDKAASEPCRDPRLGEAAEALRRRLMALEHAAGWLHESLQQHPLISLSPEELEVLGELATTARQRCEQAVRRLGALLEQVPS
jgi:ParB/RepB/Spo0J family partition protein